jgi:mannose-1-phosphate guanylyltransferase
MFFWRVSTILDQLKQHLPQTFNVLQKMASRIGTRKYSAQLQKLYPKLENISVDYAILEPVARAAAEPRIFVIPAEIGWSDIGSWQAVYELLAQSGENIYGNWGHFIESQGNFVSSPKKFIAAIGVNNLVVVETADALLICPRDRAQDVSKIVKWLEDQKLKILL